MLHYSSLFHFTLWFQARDYNGTWISDCTADFQPAVLAQKQRQPAKLSTVPMTIRKKTPLFPILTLLPPTSPLSASPLTLFSSHPWWWYCKSLDPRCRRFVRRRLLPSHHGYKPGNRVSRGVPPIRNGHGREVVVEVVFLRVHDIWREKGATKNITRGATATTLTPAPQQ